MRFKRVTLLSGHYGSGKTNVAVNLALMLAGMRGNVAVADLDIVNPYFRSLDSREELERAGIRMICSAYANTNLDVPALPQEMYAIVDDRTLSAVVDVGGDERGALALGRISDRIREENDYDMLLVVNRFRPLTRDAESVYEIMREIEDASRLPFTGIINDSNLGSETTAETVLESVPFGREVSERCGLPLVYTAAQESLCGELKGLIPDLLPLRLQKRPV